MIVPRALGWKRSPDKAADDAPDWTLDRLKVATTPPPEHDASRLVLSILDQGQLGSCVANAGFQCVRGSHVKQLLELGWDISKIKAFPPALGSRLFGYWLARSFWHETSVDAGTHIRTFYEMINRFGFPPESIWSYTDEDRDRPNAKFKQQPSTAAFMAAFDQRAPTTYVRITEGAGKVDEIKRALASDYLVEFGTLVTERFCRSDFDADKPVPRPKPSDPVAGGHALTGAGYNSGGVLVPNSWGPDWGRRGWCTLSWEYVEWEEFTDIWAVKHSPRFPEVTRALMPAVDPAAIESAVDEVIARFEQALTARGIDPATELVDPITPERIRNRCRVLLENRLSEATTPREQRRAVDALVTSATDGIADIVENMRKFRLP